MSSFSHSKEILRLTKELQHLRVRFQDIKEATKNFTTVSKKDEDVIIYKGELQLHGKVTTVTIKRLQSSISHFGLREGFLQEIYLLSSFKHSNVVSLLGFCDEENEKILIFEYAEGGSLVDYLSYYGRKTHSLTWMQRISICINVARGLNYLHQDDVVHGGIKSSNVMIGQDLKAMIGNLELSKRRDVFDQYVDIRFHGSFTKGADVFAFGVVLFEVLCGHLLDVYDDYSRLRYLNPKVRQSYVEGRINEIIDVNLRNDQVDSETIQRFADVAYQCLEIDHRQQSFISIGLVAKKLQHVLTLQGILSQVQNAKDLMIPLEDILLATNYFRKDCHIGYGGYGDVYKAKLRIKSKDDELLDVAIKRIIYREDGKGKEGFISELDVLSRCKHPNIVTLLGFCFEDDEMLLVYEYISNGSLDKCLRNIDMMSGLTWARRLNMCIHIAKGLEYMHTTTRIIHRDIKSGNILLDENMEVKIADFGLSKLRPMKQGTGTINTYTVAGTDLYWDPEYATTGRLKEASDIYSFGIVLFEIFTGKLANTKGLSPIVQRHIENGTLKDILDPKMMDDAYELGFTGKLEPDQDSLNVFSRIAYQCVANTQAERPTIDSVIKELGKALQAQETRIKTLQISLEHIRLGLGEFSDDNCIMRGRYGMLYEGKVQYNNRDKEVFVKRFSDDGYFLKEFEILFKHKHENIIGLVGYCKEMDEKIIVYEHGSKRSLDRYLNDTKFSWTQRLKICIDIATGLKFLQGGELGQDVVIHRDIKSSNILLDRNWKAKICGFELALTYPTNREIEYVMDNVEGSPGYFDPLFLETQFLTKESDIYSFGVILFEILCGRLACLEDCRDRNQFLDVVVKRHFQEVSFADDMVFEGIKEQIGKDSLATFLDIAFQCLRNDREGRPTAGDVVVQLQKALKAQEAYEVGEANLRMSPEIYSEMAKREIYNILSKGILHEHDKLEIARTIQAGKI